MPLRKITGLATTVVVLLGVQISLMAGEIIARIHRISVLSSYTRGDASVIDQFYGADQAVDAFSGFVGLALIATVIVWCIWQHHAQANAQLLAVGPFKFTPGWAVGWWFIPIANLWKPFQAMRELWKASHGGTQWPLLATWPLLGWWWGIWLASNFHFWSGSSGGGVSFGTTPAGNPVPPRDVMNLDRWEILSTVLTIVAAVLAIVIVRTITDLQQRTAAEWVPPVPPPAGAVPLPPPPPV